MKPRSMHASASAPAKVILFGEHFVVYNKPAILASIDKRVNVDVKVRDDQKFVIKSKIVKNGTFDVDARNKLLDKPSKSTAQPIIQAASDALKEFNSDIGLDLYIRSEFPVGVGLGSSAACAVATIAAVGSLFGGLTKKKVCALSMNAERIVHSNPSGADSAVCTYGGLLLYRREEGIKPIHKQFVSEFIVVDSGIKRSTGKLVSSVGQKMKNDAGAFTSLANMSENITMQALTSIKAEDYAEIGSLMTLNHSILRQLGVSKRTLDKIVQVALDNGALGAKMTGAGGGGCVIILSKNGTDGNTMKKALGEYKTFLTRIEYAGVIVNSPNL